MQRSPSKLALVVLSCLVALSACTLKQDRNYRVTSGRGVYLHVYGKPSWAIANDVYRAHCKRSVRCTADVLTDTVKIDGWGAAEFHDGVRKYDSFRGALGSALDEGWSDGWNSGRRCLVLHKSPTGALSWATEWIQPISGARDCKTGG